ncbi:MAG: hypothetical protein Q4B71_05865 [Cardiobacteriaceae bacterium]|nr:hypothetical protein [Cardiobacteriaceae bacterium]
MKKATLLALASALSMATAQAQEAKVECAADDAKCIEAAKATEGKCGEGKCGGAAAPAKSAEGKCGEGNPAPAKAAEGTCGEGKCGGTATPVVPAPTKK